MTNGELYSLIYWVRYVGLLWVWALLIFGGAGVGFWLRKSVGGVVMGIACMGAGLLVMIQWVALL